MSSDERRRHERQPTDAPIILYGPDSQPLLLGPDLMDIHGRGLRLKLCDRVEPGETLRFKIRLPTGLVRGQGRVCWLRTRLVGYECGLEIQSMGRLHAYRLGQFLNPGLFSYLKPVDVVLALAVFGVGYLVIAKWLSQP